MHITQCRDEHVTPRDAHHPPTGGYTYASWCIHSSEMLLCMDHMPDSTSPSLMGALRPWGCGAALAERIIPMRQVTRVYCAPVAPPQWHPWKAWAFLTKTQTLYDHKGLLCVAPETLIENVAYVHSYTRMQTHKHTVNTCFWMTKKIFPFPHPVVAPYFFFLPSDAFSPKRCLFVLPIFVLLLSESKARTGHLSFKQSLGRSVLIHMHTKDKNTKGHF